MKRKKELLNENQELRQRLERMEELLARYQEAKGEIGEPSLVSEWLNITGAVVAVLDREGRIMDCNQACEKAMGYTLAEVKNQPFWDIFLTAEEKDGVKDIFTRIISGAISISHDNYWVTKKGEHRLFAWSMTAVVKDEETKFVIKTGVDITEREEVEKHIAYLASFPQLSPFPILEFDFSGMVRFSNAAALKTLDRLGASGRLEAFLPADLEQIIQEAKRTGKSSFQREVWIGDSAFEDLISLPIDSGVIRIYAVDITKKKRVEELRRQSEERLIRAEEVAHLGHWDLDLKTNKVIWSEEVFRLFAQDPATFRPTFKKFVALVHPEDRDRLISNRNTALRNATGFKIDYRIVLPDHSQRVLQEIVEIIVDETGNPIRFFGTVQDITERKLLEEKLLHAQKLEAVGRLSAGVAHDFNNMLTVIIGNDEILLKGMRREDPLYGKAQGIMEAADRAAALTRQLLAFSRRQILQPQVLNLNAVIKQLQDMLQRLISEEIELVTVLDATLGNVKVDQGQIEQVLLNLVVNARDAMPRGGKLTITTANAEFLTPRPGKFDEVSPGNYIMLSISDTGAGLDPEAQARIFEPFYTTKEIGKGTGLGLATVYGIVKQSNGYIEVISQPGLGTTFTIYLPQVEEVVSTPKEPQAGPLHGSETILVVEDSDMLRPMLTDALEMYGYKVLAASSGEEAFFLSERHQGPIHLMLTDVVMSKMCGRELAEQLTPLRPEMKVLYMSAYPEDIIGPRGVLYESTQFIQKPYKLDVLLQKMRRVLDASQDK